MDSEGYFSLSLIVAAIFVSCFLFIKSLNKNTVISPLTNSNLNNNTFSESPSSAPDLVGQYEVFLSFCGKDTRYGFTDFLYTYLNGAGIHTFRDDNELRVGEEIGPELLKAIRDSKISIPIFSKNYASSKWCLRELTEMVECQANGEQMIFPIFYDVDPSDVQHQRGSYEKGFRQHKKNLDKKMVQQWEKAMTIVGELKGLELKKETNWREGELVKIIVEKVLLKLKKNYKHVPENLVGTDHHLEKLKRLLNNDSNSVRVIGILGMGGLGKTTIAKVIYNELCEFFECHCFLEDVRENSNFNRIVNLQNQLLSKILKRKISKFDDVNEGIDKIKGAIHGKKVFIVLDDVDEKSQIEKLVGNHKWYEAGSRIIITTRNEEVLAAIEVACEREGLSEVYTSYKPDFMNDDHSLVLFSKYAFMRDSPPEDYVNLAKEVVSKAAGLPLVLKTLGSLLFVEKDKGSWQEKLKKLKEIPPKEVIERLKISYDALDYEQKQIFLDIACYFAGVDKRNPCYMWDDCKFYPSEGINALVRRSLITIRDDSTLRMHDQLRELGRQIVYNENLDEPGKRSRLWSRDEALDTLRTHQGTKNVKALYMGSSEFRELKDPESPHPRLVGQDFVKVPNLRYLSLHSIDLDGDFENLLLNLRWLEWWWCSRDFAPTNFCLKNLVILNLFDRTIKDDWGFWSQIKMAKKLKVLTLSQCYCLNRLPHLSNLSSLERLEVDRCYYLSALDGLEQLESLKYLNASSCDALERLPDLSKLTKLKTLNVSFCGKLTVIQGLEKMESLELLDTSHCYSLETIPNLSNLKELKRVDVSWCKKLVEIEGLDGLGSVEHLDTSCCNSLKRLPDFSNLKMLTNLKSGGMKLTEVRGLGGLESLENLTMKNHKSLGKLLGLLNLRRLRTLKISSCDKLIEIHGLDGLGSLECFHVRECSSIKRLPDLSNLKRLKELSFAYCEKLIEIQGLDGLESLEVLDMSSLKSIERLPDLSNLRKLKELNISLCYMLIEIQGLDRLANLEKLDMRGCRSIERLPDLPNFGMLKDINMSFCDKLKDIEALRVVESVESLDVSFGRALGKILDLTNLKILKKLEIRFNLELTDIRGLEKLESLESLNIRGCKSIENLPDFSNLRNLEDLNVSCCKKLTEIRGLEQLKSLKKLCIADCDSLENLPALPNTTIRRIFYTMD